MVVAEEEVPVAWAEQPGEVELVADVELLVAAAERAELEP